MAHRYLGLRCSFPSLLVWPAGSAVLVVFARQKAGEMHLQPDRPIAVDIRDAVKTYGDFTALKHVSLAIEDNEFFTLLGPSGCGKTTLLRMIAGFEDVSAGEIMLFGQPIANLPPYQRPVNTVFQNYALFPHMNVLENVSFGLEMLGQGKAQARRRAAEVLDIPKSNNNASPAQMGVSPAFAWGIAEFAPVATMGRNA